MSPKGRRLWRGDRKLGTRAPIQRIVVVTEGESTEPGYLKVFERIYGNPSLVKLDVIRGGGVPGTLVARAVEETSQWNRDAYGRPESVWVMFDRDDHPRFKQAEAIARENNIGLAVSDPCFELWGIFHYQTQDAPIDRRQCQRMLMDLCLGYRRKGGKLFDDPDVIRRRYRDAVTRAERSLTARRREGAPEGNPSTTVHHLTEHILHVAGRSRSGK